MLQVLWLKEWDKTEASFLFIFYKKAAFFKRIENARSQQKYWQIENRAGGIGR